MAVTFRAQTGGMGTGAFTPARPSGTVSGDLLILHVCYEKGTDVSFTSGVEQWTLIARADQSTNIGMAVFWFIDDGTALDQITLNNGPKYTWTIGRFDGHDATTPIDVSASATGESGHPDPPSITPTTSPSMAVAVCGNKKAPTGTAPSGYTERWDRANTAAGLSWTWGGTKALTTTSAENPAVVTASETESWGAVTFNINEASAGGATLAAAAGSFSTNGSAAGLKRGLRIAAVAGAIALTGAAAHLGRSYDLALDVGSYLHTGQTTQFTRSLKLAASTGAYTLAGDPGELDYGRDFNLESGAYSLGQIAAGLHRGYALNLDAGSYSHTGQTADLDLSRALLASAGAYTHTGHEPTLQRASLLATAIGAYDWAGNPVNFSGSQGLQAEAGVFILSGIAAELDAALLGPVNAGAFNVAGNPAALNHGYRVILDAGSHALTGQAASFRLHSRFVVDAGGYAVSGAAAGLGRGLILDNDAGVFAWGGASTAFTRALVAHLDTGSFALNGAVTQLEVDWIEPLIAGTFVLTGHPVTFYNGYSLLCTTGVHVVTGSAAVLEYSNAGSIYPLTNIARSSSATPDAQVHTRMTPDAILGGRRDQSSVVYTVRLQHDLITQAEFTALLDHVATNGYGPYTFPFREHIYTGVLVNEPAELEQHGALFNVESVFVGTRVSA